MPSRIGIPPRAGALAIDLTGIALLSTLFAPWIGSRLGLDVYAGQGPGAGGMMAGAAAGTLLITLLWLGTEAVWGATPGKRVLGLRIGTAAGDWPTPRRRVARWALKSLPALLGLLTVVVSVALPRMGSLLLLLTYLSAMVIVAGCFIAVGSDHEALHDIATGTAVYRHAELPAPRD